MTDRYLALSYLAIILDVIWLLLVGFIGGWVVRTLTWKPRRVPPMKAPGWTPPSPDTPGYHDKGTVVYDPAMQQSYPFQPPRDSDLHNRMRIEAALRDS